MGTASDGKPGADPGRGKVSVDGLTGRRFRCAARRVTFRVVEADGLLVRVVVPPDARGVWWPYWHLLADGMAEVFDPDPA